jgi:hypothetical protein
MAITHQHKLIIQRMAQEAIAKEKEELKTKIVSDMMAATLMTLHDKYDWQPEKLVAIMAEIFNQFDSVSKKFVKLQDFYDWLESIGITIKEDKAK